MDDREESMSQGSVPFKVHVKYFSSGVGWLSFIFMIFTLVFGQVRLFVGGAYFNEQNIGESLFRYQS